MSKVDPDPLKTIFSSDLVINGVTTTPADRTFISARPEVSNGPISELIDGEPVPYPDRDWNSWKPGEDGGHRFVGVNAIRIGPDGALWVVDRGASIGQPQVPGAVKLVQIDVAANEVARIYDLAPVTNSSSFVDDVRFNGRLAYLTDAGQAGVIVMDLSSGHGRRVLDGHPSMVGSRMTAEGRELRLPNGDPIVVHADQLEVSPDGRWFYYQPASGGMSRIATEFLDEPDMPDAELATHVEHFADTPATGGTAIDSDGNIYLSDLNELRILKITPAGAVSTLIADPRLTWVDAMWIDDHGNLLMPANQLNRTAIANGGINAVQQPLKIYAMAIGAKPVRR